MDMIKPLPEINESNKPFWDGLKAREFRIPRCGDCGTLNWTPYPACRNCLSENLEWIATSGKGTLYTHSTVYRPLPAFADEAPYIVAVVELEEGPLVMSNLIDIEESDVTIGMPVQVVFEDIDDGGVTLYKFRAA